MVTFEEALATVLAVRPPEHHETVMLQHSLGRVLADSLKATHDWPPFDRSAMDGYAIRAGDHSPTFRVVEQIPAGKVPSKALGVGECAKIMTGAMLPRGAGKVVPVEMTEERDGAMEIMRPSAADNIRRMGENGRAGDTLLPRGTLIGAPEIGTIASTGLSQVKVGKAPTVGLVTTGSELQDPGQPLGRGRIYNSNGPQLEAQLARMHLAFRHYGTITDELGATVRVLEQALDQCTVVLVSGGVSVGDWDFVPEAMRRVGVDLKFEKIAVKPGHPTAFGRREDQCLFGLPGNPVSTFVLFEVLVKPFLLHLMGHRSQPLYLYGTLAEALSRKHADRLEFRPVRYHDGVVHTVAYHGSSHLNALCGANALLEIPRGDERIPKGTVVHVRQI